MPPSDETPPASSAEESFANQSNPPSVARARRRVVFPWVWLGSLAGARLAMWAADVPLDFQTLASLLGIGLGVIGVALWYAVRGRGPVALRLVVGAAPFLFGYVFFSMYQVRHSGDGWIIGFHRRGVADAHQRIATLQADTPNGGLADWAAGPHDYPRFLGSGPWAESFGPPIDPDWEANPPEELWRRPVGAGWSSFAVYGPYAITQEQRGEEELVACYRAETGEPVWVHSEPAEYVTANFAGEMGRVGPRATPTIVGDRVFTHGAGGLVLCLDSRSGEVIWSVDGNERFGADTPIWGKSGSPLYVESVGDTGRDLVVINVGAPVDSVEGEYNSSLVAFDVKSGEVVWQAGWRQTSYASPQMVELHDERVVLQSCDDQVQAYSAEDGRLLFEFPLSGQSDNRPSCSQLLPVEGDRLLLTKGYGHGASLIEVTRNGDSWAAEPFWSPAIKPVLRTKFSNAVIRDGHAYALHEDKLDCVEIETGQRKWRQRRRPSFGHGQLMLAGEWLAVLSEQGELILVDASPDGYRERASLQALSEDETCWNNPVVAGDLLLVRNAVEAAAYRLPVASP